MWELGVGAGAYHSARQVRVTKVEALEEEALCMVFPPAVQSTQCRHLLQTRSNINATLNHLRFATPYTPDAM